jgi:mannitol operon repressor
MDLTGQDALAPVIAELHIQSDRACAIVAASMLENMLETVIVRSMVPGTTDALLGAYAPLSTFRGKIDLALAMGLIGKSEAHDLNRVRKIRNSFAHSLEPLSFDRSPVREHVQQLVLSAASVTGKAQPPRNEFQDSVMMLTGFLHGKADRASPCDPAPDIAEGLARCSECVERESNEAETTDSGTPDVA